MPKVLRGIVEGFYGRPYSFQQRNSIIRLLERIPEAVYLYAPKNDPLHRLKWRESYSESEWQGLEENFRTAEERGVLFIFGLSPWGFAAGDGAAAAVKLRRALDAGAGGVALLFDDIPEKADGELASRQLRMAEESLEGLECPVFLCPSVYCRELLERLEGNDYLKSWRENVSEDRISFWTGEAVVSRSIEPDFSGIAAKELGPGVALWDNYLADDYALRRIYLDSVFGRIPRDTHYFLNPSECFPAALFSVYRLICAMGADDSWPEELGNCRESWELMAEFHCSPWSCGSRARGLINDLEKALRGEETDVLRRLNEMHGTLEDFLDRLETVAGGFSLMPYVRDVKRFLSQWMDVLPLPGAGEKRRELHRLLYCRLPYENPLAAMTADAAEKE